MPVLNHVEGGIDRAIRQAEGRYGWCGVGDTGQNNERLNGVISDIGSSAHAVSRPQ